MGRRRNAIMPGPTGDQTVMSRSWQNPAPIAAAVQEQSEGYYPGSAGYSPSLTPGLDSSVGRITYAYQMDSPEKSTQGTPDVRVPRPPLPSMGGEPGRSQPLGYSTGLLPSKTFRQPFRGAVLVRPTMGANPVGGPVGRSSRQDRLQAGVKALTDVYLPSTDQVRQMFTTPRNVNPLDIDAALGGGA